MENLLAEMSWEPWVGLATIAIGIVAALVAVISRLVTVEVVQKVHGDWLRKIDSTVFPKSRPRVYRREDSESESDSA